jgi:hypothetical protein
MNRIVKRPPLPSPSPPGEEREKTPSRGSRGSKREPVFLSATSLPCSRSVSREEEQHIGQVRFPIGPFVAAGEFFVFMPDAGFFHLFR